MKKTLNFIIKPVLLLVLIAFTGCEKDLYEDSIQNESRKMKVSKISLKDIEKSVSTRIKGEIKKVKNMKYETTSEGNRIEYNAELNIYIDTENGNLVSVDGKNFYTFPMFKDEDNKIENVLFVDNGNDEMDTYLIKYDITPEEFENLANEQIQDIDVEYQKVFWSGGEQVCFSWFYTTTVYPNCDQPNGYHPTTGLQCEGEVHVTSSTLCTFVEVFGQGDSLGGNGGDGVGGDTSGGHTGGGSTGNTIYTGIGTSPELIKMKDFVKDFLDDNQEACYVQQTQQAQNNIFVYLVENDFTNISQQFIKDCLDKINQDPNDVLTSIIPFLIEKQIDDSELDPCSKSVLNALKGLENNDIKKILSRLNNPDTVYKTIIKTEQYPGFDLGQTTHPIPNKFIIKLRTNYIDGTDHEPNSTPTTLSIASTIIHEIIHAHLHSLYDDYNNGNSSEFNNFPLLFDAYVSHTYPGGSPVDAQHEVMANNFVNLIASALQEFQTGIPVNEGQAPSEVYLDMAWGTFSGTPIFNHLFPNTGDVSLDIVRNRILNRRFAEARNQPIGDQTPIGTPCN